MDLRAGPGRAGPGLRISARAGVQFSSAGPRQLLEPPLYQYDLASPVCDHQLVDRTLPSPQEY